LRKGFALVTVLILSLIALIFTGAAIYISTKSTKVSGGEKRYRNVLDCAKGISFYLIDQMINDELRNKVANFSLCKNNNCNEPIYIPPGVFPSNYEVNATLLSVVYPSDGGTVYTVEVKVKNKNTGEKVTIDFGYEVY
jgi:hypothetical protein